MSRKVIIIGIAVFFSQIGAMTQTVGALIVSLLFYGAQLKFKPAASPVLNTMEEWSHVVLIASFVIGFLLFASKIEWTHRAKHELDGAAKFAATTLTLVLVSIHSLYLAWWLFVFVPEARRLSEGKFGFLKPVVSKIKLTITGDGVEMQETTPEIRKTSQILEMSQILGRVFKHSDEADALKTFTDMDTDGNGKIDLDELMSGLSHAGFTERELGDLFDKVSALYEDGFELIRQLIRNSTHQKRMSPSTCAPR